jgi:ABC-2 type transport system permease protein
MSLRTVVEDDLLRLRRSPLGWGVALAVLAPTAGVGLLVVLFELVDATGQPPAPFDNIMMAVGVLLSFGLPFVAMLGSYSAIVHERESGSIRFLLGFPNSRLDAYAGKYVSRTVLLSVSVLVGFAVLGAVGFGILQEPDAVALLAFLLATVAFALVFVGFGVAISGVANSLIGATAAIIGTYVVFRGGWMILQYGALYLARGGENVARPPYPDWYFFIGRINPINAFVTVLVDVLDRGPQTLARQVLITQPRPEVNTVATDTSFAALALLGWLVVTPLVGYLVFRQRDLL